MTSGNFKLQDCDMDASFGESTPSHKTFCSSTSSNDAADFECNICFELAREPIVTLCGHLFCWPCLYKWLNIHSYSHECPVCKALVQEKKLVPLYGRGKTPSDLQSQSTPGNDIPNRPAGQRPRTAPHPRANHFPQRLGFWLLGGIMPAASVRIGGLALSTALSGLIPSLFNLQVHGFHDFTVYGTFSGFPYGFHNTYHGGPAHGFHERLRQQQRSDSSLVKMCLLLFGVLTIIYVIL